MSRILLIGGSGMLGTELRKLNADIIAPPKVALNIIDPLRNYFDYDTIVNKCYNYDIVINAAAIKDNRKIESDPIQAIETNIIGAARVAMKCVERNARYVYISTDYLYKGDRGNYTEEDEILPFNLYAWTKLGGECSARAVKNHLIIRTSFGEKFEYPEAFTDKWASKDYVDVIAPLILEAALSPITGVLNIGTERKTIYDHAIERNDQVKPVRLADTSHNTPYDTSMNLQKWMDYKSGHPIAKPHTKCRVCGSEKMVKYMDLGLMPLANNLEFTSLRARNKERFPLQVMFCQECYLSQLSVVIDPGKMFSYYTYRSSVNAGYIKHCKELCEDVSRYLPDEDVVHVDIAGNDGTLLLQALRVHDNSACRLFQYKVINVDPATNLAAISESQGIETIADFWGPEVAKRIFDKYDQVDMITATNVFAHVDNLTVFLLSTKALLKMKGVLVIECPYLVDFIDNFEFDTVYFEHLSYMSVIPIDRVCRENKLKVLSVERRVIHGGSIRVIISHDDSPIAVDSNVQEFMDYEQAASFTNLNTYLNWNADVKKVIQSFSNQLVDLKKSGKKIAAFAASAKGNTLLNSAGINTDIIDYIVDQTPEKIGKYSPGTGIPIVHIQELVKNPPDYLVILSWNFKDEIIEKLKPIYGGKFIIPIPTFQII